MSAPILQPGDQVHLVLPLGTDPAEDERRKAETVAAYAALGVNVAILTTIGLASHISGQRVPVPNEPRVVAVFRGLPPFVPGGDPT